MKVARTLHKQHQTAKLVFLSMHVDDERRFAGIRTGASAFLTKDTDHEVLLDALRRVVAGENLINGLVLARPRLAWRVLAEIRSLATGEDGAAEREPFLPLSAREVEVLDCVAQGFSNREIADEFFVTEQTVKSHMTSVLRKLDVNDRVRAVLYAVKHGRIELGPRPHAATVTGASRQSPVARGSRQSPEAVARRQAGRGSAAMSRR